MLVVAKVGTSSLTTREGELSRAAFSNLAAQLAELARREHRVVVVSSGAVAAGAAAYSPGGMRSSDPVTLQALSSIGQQRLMRAWDDALAAEGLLAGQVLLAPLDFAERGRYLRARETLQRLLALGVVPVVNENDAIADDEIRFGDNDRLAALVAHLLRADLMVLLTDQPGLFSADPRLEATATLIEEVTAVDHEAAGEMAGPSQGPLGRGGMASKLQAARMAAWSGVTTLIASAERPGVLLEAAAQERGIGTLFRPHDRRLPARKLWIAFALRPKGRLRVDAGAEQAVVARSSSLLPAGVTAAEGSFGPEDAVELVGPSGLVFAKGICQVGADRAPEWLGRKSDELPAGFPSEVVHRDDLVVLAGQ